MNNQNTTASQAIFVVAMFNALFTLFSFWLDAQLKNTWLEPMAAGMAVICFGQLVIWMIIGILMSERK